MNRVLLSQIEQLKCNFCTQWFSVPSQFASLQKYSLNACQKCLTDFKYRLVDPTSFEIYDVVLIKTGIQLTNKQYQLTQRFQAFMKMHRDSLNLSEQSSYILKEQDMRNSDLKAEINMHTQPIKERVSQTCKKFIDGVIKRWNQILSQIQKGSNLFDDHKEKIIKVLSDRYYNFAKDPQQLLSNQRVQFGANRLKQISEQTKKMTSQAMLNKIRNFIGQFFGLQVHNQADASSFNTQNKQNKTPNQKLHLRNIRQKLMRNSRRCQNNVLKLNFGNQLKVNCTNIKSSKKDMNKSSQKSLLKPQPLLLKKQRSDKSLKINTPRSYRLEFQNIQVEKPTCVIDQYRDKMSRLIKQSNQFETYMPIQPHKNQAIQNKTYGQKCMIEYLVQLKMKTTLNNNMCELINQNLSKGNLGCYLRSLEWKNSITIIRFVKVKMHDSQFDIFLNWLSDKSSVQIIVITNNLLTQLSIQAIHAFCLRHRHMGLRQIYMGNNYIKPSKAKKAIQGLKAINIQVYI